MKFFVRTVLILFVLIAGCKEKPRELKVKSPRDLYPGLFDAVQTAHIFPDSKTFPDCIPEKTPEEILQEFQERKAEAGFNLKQFVEENFEQPEQVATDFKTDKQQGIEEHIDELWDVLRRKSGKYDQYSSLINLPNPYIVPGGRFREIYYWDSYFTMLGLQESNKEAMIEDMVNNFAWLIRTYGFIPNGNRTYYLTRSQPPFFSLMLQLLMEIKKNKADAILKANRDVLEKEYHFWMNDQGVKKGASNHVVHLPDGSILNRYFDKGDWPREEAYVEDVKTAVASGRSKPVVWRDLRSGAESGWDFSSRWFADGKSLATIQTTDIIPVDLNCLLYHTEKMLALAYEKLGEQRAKEHMEEAAERRRSAVERFCFDRRMGYFRDYNWKTLKQTDQITLAGMYPLYFKMVTQGQAQAVARMLQKQFLKPGGLVTSLVNTGEQWDAPNGWAPLQWLAIQGLRNYRQDALANEVAKRWSGLNIRVFHKTGKLLEKYNVIDTTLIAGGGEYPTQDGFGWTNGVLLKILKSNKQ
ncbi:alpha,alpha-trehalase TreF [Pedobacter sp. SYSU D00535]|uniref:alpha,alpha-trehalase TreF n=1 Tax=Pedobacter sp. SYSU D00535 TaxID=2810308 RepID=UPI001A97BEAB|nr:alpha,alpha-trehalase TreF [Pedobacter sp. SYSU D00535]